MNRQPRAATTLGLALALTATLPSTAWADADHGKHGTHTAQAPAQASAADMTEGEVRKVDKEGGKLTLKHADIKSLDMPAMTMVFVVRDKALLDMVKAGDKVRFKAVNDAGKFTVTEMQVAK